MTVRVATCTVCGMSWEHYGKAGLLPAMCRVCRVPIPRNGRDSTPRIRPSYDMAAEVVRYRLAFEQATALLEMNRPGEALAVLYEVEAPARKWGKDG